MYKCIYSIHTFSKTLLFQNMYIIYIIMLFLCLYLFCQHQKRHMHIEKKNIATVRFSEQIMSADKYPSIFSRQMKVIVYIYIHLLYDIEVTWRKAIKHNRTRFFCFLIKHGLFTTQSACRVPSML